MEPRVFGNLLQRPEVPLHLGAVHLDFLERKASQYPDFGELKESALSHSRSIWGHTGITHCRLPQHSTLQPWGSRLSGSRDVTLLASNTTGKQILHFFPFCSIFRSGIYRLITSIGAVVCGLVLGVFCLFSCFSSTATWFT